MRFRVLCGSVADVRTFDIANDDQPGLVPQCRETLVGIQAGRPKLFKKCDVDFYCGNDWSDDFHHLAAEILQCRRLGRTRILSDRCCT